MVFFWWKTIYRFKVRFFSFFNENKMVDVMWIVLTLRLIYQKAVYVAIYKGILFLHNMMSQQDHLRRKSQWKKNTTNCNVISMRSAAFSLNMHALYLMQRPGTKLTAIKKFQ